ncbi:putative reverse transcriptase domain-containing protein [Tanacetum coccineum]|uniref:Reverse transcriptase domain-containing protein n=1 Tax=Tanacetum coccineum TaxID=301880 RepID=A0ABQ4YGR0_9ASTR
MVFGISECAEARKGSNLASMHAPPTPSRRALTWTEEFCPIEEVQRMEHELWNLKVKEFDITAYTKRFHELVQLCPEMVPSERKKIEAYIRGLTDNIKGTVIGSKPISLNEAVRMAHALMEQKSQARIERIAEGNKRKWESSQGGNNGNNRNNNRDNTRHNQQNNQRQGHMARDCKGKAIATGANTRPTVTVFMTVGGEKGTHKELIAERKRDPQGEEARGRAYVIRDAEKQQGPNVVTDFKNKTLVIRRANRGATQTEDKSCIKASKYIERGHQLFVAHVTEKEPKEKRLEDVPVIRDFPEVFPDDLPGLPPPRQVEFKIELELADQLQELSEKGFIRPSSSPWGAPVLFVKKKDGSFRMAMPSHKGFGAVLCRGKRTDSIKEENVTAENLGTTDPKPIFETLSDGIHALKGIWLPIFGGYGI